MFEKASVLLKLTRVDYFFIIKHLSSTFLTKSKTQIKEDKMKRIMFFLMAVAVLAIFSSQAVAENDVGRWRATDGYIQARSYADAGSSGLWTKYTAGIKVWDPVVGEFPDKNVVVIEVWKDGEQIPITFKENFHFTFFRNYDVNSADFPKKPYQEDRFWTGDIGTMAWECGKYTFKVWIGNDAYSEYSVWYVGPIYLPAPGTSLKREPDAKGGMYVIFDFPRGFPDPGVGMQVKVYAEAEIPNKSWTVTVQDKIPGHMGMTYYSPEILAKLRALGATGFNVTVYTRANDNSARTYLKGEPFWVPFP